MNTPLAKFIAERRAITEKAPKGKINIDLAEHLFLLGQSSEYSEEACIAAAISIVDAHEHIETLLKIIELQDEALAEISSNKYGLDTNDSETATADYFADQCFTQRKQAREALAQAESILPY